MTPCTWHYTTGQKLKLILESGVLKPTAIGVRPPELPLLWFSSAPYWEPTACKAILTGPGTIRTLTMRETYAYCEGLVRFGYDSSKLWRGAELLKKSRMRQRDWDGLVREGLRQKANPAQWFGTAQALPLEEMVTIERMNEAFQWESLTQSV